MNHAQTLPQESATDSRPAPVTSDVPVIKSVRATGSWQGSMATEVRVRDFTFRSDEPVAVGGTNSAPTPMEFVAGAVNGCITVVIETVAAELGIRLERVDTETAAHIDVRGFRGTAEVSPHFHDYLLRVSIAADASEEDRATLRRQVEKRCPALNLVRDAGVPLELQWEFRAGSDATVRRGVSA